MVDAHDATDYVIVGAGSAGSVIVRRLLDAGHSVHVIEAGPLDTDPAIHSAQGWPSLLGGPLDWTVFTTPQPHANNRRLFWPRGKVLGGSSSLNGMIYIRGHTSDYERWAQATADRGWCWESVLPLFKRSEVHEQGASEYHGAAGPLPVSTIATPHPLSEAFVDGAVANGHKLIEDFNAGEMVGVGYNHITARRGERISAWKGFVKPVLRNPRLKVTTRAFVHRILLENGEAVGVEYAPVGQPPRRAYAAAEIVLAAGVLGSPKTLLLSGIGPSGRLTSLGLPTMVDLPGVGENLHDHLLVSNLYEAREPVPAGVNNLLEAQLFAYSGQRDGAAPDLQPLFIHVPYATDGGRVPEHGYTIAAGLVAPKSRGTLRLASANPADLPLADPNVLADPRDLEALVDALEMCREIGASTPFARWRKAEVTPVPAAATRDELRAFVRRAVGTYHHQVGTCKMGAEHDPNAVVGPDLRVRGVQGLRVADASIMPVITSGNTNAPTIMIGEKAADLLLAS